MCLRKEKILKAQLGKYHGSTVTISQYRFHSLKKKPYTDTQRAYMSQKRGSRPCLFSIKTKNLVTTRSSNNSCKFFNLLLGANKSTKLIIKTLVYVQSSFLLSTYSSLAKLLGTLVLGVLDQFHETTFIGSITSDLTDNGLDKSGTLGGGLI